MDGHLLGGFGHRHIDPWSLVLTARSSHAARNNQGHRLSARVFTAGARCIAAITRGKRVGNSIPWRWVHVFTAHARCIGSGNSIQSPWVRVFCCRDHLPLCKCSVTHGHDMSVTRAQKQRDYYDLLHFLQNIRCAPTGRLEGC